MLCNLVLLRNEKIDRFPTEYTVSNLVLKIGLKAFYRDAGFIIFNE